MPVDNIGWEPSEINNMADGIGWEVKRLQSPSGIYQLEVEIVQDTMVPKDGYGLIQIVQCIWTIFVNIVSDSNLKITENVLKCFYIKLSRTQSLWKTWTTS